MIGKVNKVSIFYAILRDGITIHVHLINTLEGDVWGVGQSGNESHGLIDSLLLNVVLAVF